MLPSQSFPVPSLITTAPSSLLPQCGGKCEAVSAEIDTALRAPFQVNSVSYSGRFELADQNCRLDFDSVARSFGCSGTHHLVEDPLLCSPATVVIDDVRTPFSVHGSKRLGNYMIIKFTLLGLNLSFKMYSTWYWQLYGAADVIADNAAGPSKRLAARQVGDLVVAAITKRISAALPGAIVGPACVTVLGLSGRHDGVAEVGYAFDLNKLETVLDQERPLGASLKRSARNGSLVLKLGEKQGSQLFHATGTTQVFGLRTEPDEAVAFLRDLVTRHPEVIRPATSARRIRTQPRTARTKREREAVEAATVFVTPPPREEESAKRPRQLITPEPKLTTECVSQSSSLVEETLVASLENALEADDGSRLLDDLIGDGGGDLGYLLDGLCSPSALGPLGLGLPLFDDVHVQ